MRKICLTLILTLFLTAITFARNNEPPASSRIISGKVIDRETGEALAGVKIEIKGSDKSCYTDLNGNYILTLNPSSETNIEVIMAGYTSLTLKSAELGLEKDIAISSL